MCKAWKRPDASIAESEKLNIYCNTSCTDSKKPVMVWIHGGGFCAEFQASPLYDLTNIAYTDTMEHGIRVTQNFLTATDCQTMDELMELTTEELVDAYLKASLIDKNCLPGTANVPFLDGVTLLNDQEKVMYDEFMVTPANES